MLWFGCRRALRELELRVKALEIDNPAKIAAMVNAADLLKRAAARWERSGPKNDDGEATSYDDIRRRRGGF